MIKRMQLEATDLFSFMRNNVIFNFPCFQSWKHAPVSIFTVNYITQRALQHVLERDLLSW